MPNPLTPADLAAIRERADTATPGPWHAGHPDDTAVWTANHIQVADCSGVERSLERQQANARHVAHARTDVPALLTEVERLQYEARFTAQALREHTGVHKEAEVEWARLNAEVERLRGELKGWTDGVKLGEAAAELSATTMISYEQAVYNIWSAKRRFDESEKAHADVVNEVMRAARSTNEKDS